MIADLRPEWDADGLSLKDVPEPAIAALDEWRVMAALGFSHTCIVSNDDAAVAGLVGISGHVRDSS
jgi:hypothetical protein